MNHRPDVFYVIGKPVWQGLGWLFTSLETVLLGFLVEREAVMKILALQEFYKSLIYFGFISINVTLNQINILKHYFTYILPLGYYHHFSELWITLYKSTDNMPLDKSLPISPNHSGHSFPNTFMMMSVYIIKS